MVAKEKHGALRDRIAAGPAAMLPDWVREAVERVR
jgi:hypothetical protein